MRKKRLNKILGVLLAITLPLTLIGAVSMVVLFPKQELYSDMMDGKDHQGFWSMPWFIDDYRGNNGHMSNHMNGSMKDHMNGGKNDSTNDESSDNKTEYMYDNISSIDISDVLDNIVIVQSEDDKTRIVYNGKGELSANKKGEQLTIKDQSYSNFGFNFKGVFDDAKLLTLEVGKNVNRIEVEAGFSKIEIGGIDSSSLSVENGFGSLVIKDSNFNGNVSIEGGMGSVLMENVKSSVMDIELGMAALTLDRINTNKVFIESGMTNIKILDSNIDLLKTDGGLGSLDIQGGSIGKHIKN